MSFEIAFALCLLISFAVVLLVGLAFSALLEMFKSPACRMQELNDRIKNHTSR